MALQQLGSQAALEDCEAKIEDTASRQAPSQPAVFCVISHPREISAQQWKRRREMAPQVAVPLQPHKAGEVIPSIQRRALP